MSIEDKIAIAIVKGLQKAVKKMDEVDADAITMGFVNAIRFTSSEWKFDLADRVAARLLAAANPNPTK